MMKCQTAFLLVLFAFSARADEYIERAKVYFEAGRQAYEATDFPTAIRSFEEADAAAHKPFITFALAHAYRKQFIVDRDARKLKRAVALYHRYLDEVPQGGRRDDAIGYLDSLEPQLLRLEAERPIAAAPEATTSTQLLITSAAAGATAAIDGGEPAPIPATKEAAPGPHRIRVEAPGCVPREVQGLAVAGRLIVVDVPLAELPARVTLSANGGADVEVDGRNAGTAPLDGPLEIAAGRHQLAVTQRGHEPFARAVEVHPGETLTLDAQTKVTGQRRASYWVLGGAATLLAAGGVTTFLAVHAEAKADDILARRAAMNISPGDVTEYYEQRDRRDTMVTASEILIGTGIAAAAAGIVLYLSDNPRAEVMPSVRPGEVRADYRVRF